MSKTIPSVCSGNYCRSPMISGLLHRQVEHRSQARQIVVRSPGRKDAYGGGPPALRTMFLSQAVGPSADGPDPGVQRFGLLRECADLIEGYVVRGCGEIVRRVGGE